MPIDPIEYHRSAIAALSARHRLGEIGRDEFVAESTPHARAVAAIEQDAERDGVIALVKVALANPAVVEALAVGAAHFLKARGRTAAGPGTVISE